MTSYGHDPLVDQIRDLVWHVYASVPYLKVGQLIMGRAGKRWELEMWDSSSSSSSSSIVNSTDKVTLILWLLKIEYYENPEFFG